MLTSLGVPIANLMGVVSSNIFQSKDAPKYVPALATTTTLGATGTLLTLILGAWIIVDIKRRDVRVGKTIKARDIPTELQKDEPVAEEYRRFL